MLESARMSTSTSGQELLLLREAGLSFHSTLRRDSNGCSLLLPDEFLFSVEYKRDAGPERIRVNELVATIEHGIQFGYLFNGAKYERLIRCGHVAEESCALVVAKIPRERPVIWRSDGDACLRARASAPRKALYLLDHVQKAALRVSIDIRISVVIVIIEVQDDGLRA